MLARKSHLPCRDNPLHNLLLWKTSLLAKQNQSLYLPKKLKN